MKNPTDRVEKLAKISSRVTLALVVVILVFLVLATRDEVDPWDGKYQLKDGTMVCTLGALDYLHCDRTGTGYHRFRFLDNGALVGDLGALTYLLDSGGTRLSAGYHEITPDEGGGYTAKIGALVVRLDEEGELVQQTCEPPASDQQRGNAHIFPPSCSHLTRRSGPYVPIT